MSHPRIGGYPEDELCIRCEKHPAVDEDTELCRVCKEADNERGYQDYQDRLMESGGYDDSKYRQDMKDAGRGHLLR